MVVPSDRRKWAQVAVWHRIIGKIPGSISRRDRRKRKAEALHTAHEGASHMRRDPSGDAGINRALSNPALRRR
jgi:hypothetical protein